MIIMMGENILNSKYGKYLEYSQTLKYIEMFSNVYAYLS